MLFSVMVHYITKKQLILVVTFWRCWNTGIATSPCTKIIQVDSVIKVSQQSLWVSHSIGLVVGHIRANMGDGQLVMGWDRLSLLSKHKNEEGKKTPISFPDSWLFEVYAKCIKGLLFPRLYTCIYTTTHRKRRDLLANQLIMGHTVRLP